MAIKSASSVVADVQMAAQIDGLLADLREGDVSKERIQETLTRLRSQLAVPTHYLSDDERAELIISAIQGSDSPLEYARLTCTRHFFANQELPHGVRRCVAQFLVGAFGAQGNPMWQTYLEGTFQLIELPVDED